MFVLCGLWEMMFVLTIILSAPIPLVIIVSSLQDQLLALQSQLDHANEKVDAYFAWAKQKYSQITHNSTIGKALAYSINQEEYLRVFLSDGNVPMDNNYAEQAIRPFTIGRKNFVMIECTIS